MQKHGVDIPLAEPMNFSVDIDLLKKLHQWARYMACIVLLISLSILIGWAFKLDFFIRPVENSTAMNPVTASCFLLFCIAFMISSGRASGYSEKRIELIAIFFFMSISVIRLAGLLLKWDWQIDEVIFHNEIIKANSRLAAGTSVCFLCSGISFLLSDATSQIKQTVSQLLAIAVFLFALFALMGHIYNVPEFKVSLPFLSMSIQSVISFLLISTSILFLNAGSGIFKELVSSDSGGVTFRKLIFYALIIPVVLGFLRLIGYWAGLFSTEFGVSLLVVSVIVAFIPVLWYNTVLLNKRDRQRKLTEAKFELLLDAAPDATVVVNNEGVIQLTNRQVENLFGYAKEELIGQQVEILIPQDVRKKHVHHRSGFFKEAGIRPMGIGIELRAIKKDQSSFPVEISLSPITTSEGLLVSASIRDITDRKKAEEKFRSLLDAAPDATIIVNDKGLIEMINNQTENLFGFQRAELIGKSIELLIPENVRMKHTQHRANFIRSPKVRTMGAGIELHAIKKDGTTFPVEISLSPLQTEEGILVSASVRDITERKKAEQKLKDSEEKLSLLFNSIDEGFCIIEMIFDEHKKPVDYRFLVVNPSFEKQTGLHDAAGKRMREFAPNHEEHWFEIYGKIALTGEPIRFTNRAEQLHRWYDVYAFRFGEPKNLQVAILFNDITERKQADELIKKQRQEIQDFIDSMSTMCAKVTVDGELLMVNETAIQASGLSKEDLMKTNFLEGQWWTFDREVHARVKAAFKKACSGETITYDENIFVFGQVLNINFGLTPIFKPNKEVDYIVAEGRDISALKNTEAALTERTNQLVKLNEELEAFTYSVSHDLRAPLRGIIGFTNILEEDYSSKLDNEAKRITSVIKNNTLKMGHLIDDLLTFSRIGKKEITKTNVDTMTLVREIINEMSLQNNDKNISWKIGSLHAVNADINTIRQVWINLISNAIKYSAKKDQQRIEIGSFDQEKEIVFYVKDNGVGFDELYKHKLFKVFQRLHGPEEFEGTGVGLALVERIVSKHGGRVWAEGKLNEGASFYFSLPI